VFSKLFVHYSNHLLFQFVDISRSIFIFNVKHGFCLTLNWHLTKIVPIQKLDQPSQMCSKVRKFVRIFKIQLHKDVEKFKSNPLVLKKWNLVYKWKIPIIESLVFNVLGNFQNYKLLDNCTKISWFIDSKNSKVDRMPSIWMMSKIIVQNWVEMRNKWMVKVQLVIQTQIYWSLIICIWSLH
jgi:hypothetical protein